MAKSLAEMLGEARAEIETVSPAVASDEMASGGVVFLDVREPIEWEQHIPGAFQVPRGLLEFTADPASPRHNEVLDPARRVIVYCNSGGRAALATLTLKTVGYQDVANLDGGFTAWRSAGLPTTEHHGQI